MNERCSQRLIDLFKVTWLVSSRAGTEFKSSDSGPGLFALTLSEGKREPLTYERPSLGLEFSIQPEIIEEERQTHTFFIKFNTFAFCDSIAYSLSLSFSLFLPLFPSLHSLLLLLFFQGIKKTWQAKHPGSPPPTEQSMLYWIWPAEGGLGCTELPRPAARVFILSALAKHRWWMFFFFYKGEKKNPPELKVFSKLPHLCQHHLSCFLEGCQPCRCSLGGE